GGGGPPPVGGPNNPQPGGIPHYTRYLYNTEGTFPARTRNLEENKTVEANNTYRSLAGELLAYARWGDQQKRDVGDLVVRGNNALLRNEIITPFQYDDRNDDIKKVDTFGAPGNPKQHALDTYNEYKDKDPRIVGYKIKKKIRNYVADASRIWPTATQPAQPRNYVLIP
ncbi:hypothetical protein EB008_05500, partial [bacterium]|nr:hypothetical protein [bacterium]